MLSNVLELANAANRVSAYGFRLVYRIRTVLDIRCAAAGRVKCGRLEHIGVRSHSSKLCDEHCAVDVSVAAAIAVNVSFTNDHDHAVEVEVTIQGKISGND